MTNIMKKLNTEKIENLPYVQFMALLDEVNRPPGGKMSVRRSVQNSFISHASKVLDIGCNTGFCTFEIAHLTKARVTGIDINTDMIAASKRYQSKDPLGHLVDFLVADGMKMPFKNGSFDVAFSGGSTAFIDDKQKAICEYARVVKPWGFVVDINFFYHKKPPAALLKEMNALLGIDIQPWGLKYWTNLYTACGLEQYYLFTEKVKLVSKKQVKIYCHAISQDKKYPSDIESAIYKRLACTMTLFNKNHSYLSYGIFISRKRPDKEQVSLFDQQI